MSALGADCACTSSRRRRAVGTILVDGSCDGLDPCLAATIASNLFVRRAARKRSVAATPTPVASAEEYRWSILPSVELAVADSGCQS